MYKPTLFYSKKHLSKCIQRWHLILNFRLSYPIFEWNVFGIKEIALIVNFSYLFLCFFFYALFSLFTYISLYFIIISLIFILFLSFFCLFTLDILQTKYEISILTKLYHSYFRIIILIFLFIIIIFNKK